MSDNNDNNNVRIALRNDFICIGDLMHSNNNNSGRASDLEHNAATIRKLRTHRETLDHLDRLPDDVCFSPEQGAKE